MIHEDVRDMDAQEYSMSGLEARDRQEAEAYADEYGKDCLTCYTFPNECCRPSHQCPDRQLRVSAEAVVEDDYTFSIAKSEFVHHIADAYKAGVAAGQAAHKSHQGNPERD